MANIRKLKKEIKILVNDLITECNAFINFHPEFDRKKGEKIISDITKKEQEIIYEINHLKDSKDIKARAYYINIINKVKKEMVPLLDEIGKMVKK